MSPGDPGTAPPDPAGTQPKVDRDALLPARVERPVDAGPAAEPDQERPAPLPEPVERRPPGAPAVRHEAPHAARFQFLLGALLAVGAIAVVGLIWAVGQTRDSGDPPWSPWRPQGRGIAAAQEIAAHVGPQYKTSDGKQLVLVTASEMSIGEVDLEIVERQQTDAGGEARRVGGNAIIYRFCGMGKRCAIQGKPSEARALLLRREALEIAGYTFAYLPDVDHVVVFMPPGPLKVADTPIQKGQTVMLGNHVLLLRRSELGPLLDAPLRASLKAPPPTPRTIRTSPDAELVSALVGGNSFFYSLSQGQSDSSAFLVLDKQPQPEQIREAAEQAALEQALEKATRNAALSGRRAPG